MGKRDMNDSQVIRSSLDPYIPNKLPLAIVCSGNSPFNLSMPRISPVTKTPKMAPVDEMPTRPKLSTSLDLLLDFNAEIPAARASIKGTVTAPVVAPEASNAMAIKSLDEKIERIRIKP